MAETHAFTSQTKWVENGRRDGWKNKVHSISIIK